MSTYACTIFPLHKVYAVSPAGGKVEIAMGGDGTVSMKDTITAGAADFDGISLDCTMATYPWFNILRFSGSDISIGFVDFYIWSSIIGDGLFHTVSWSGIVINGVYALPDGFIRFTVPANRVGAWYPASFWLSSGGPPLPVVHSFPWVGRFQLCKVLYIAPPSWFILNEDGTYILLESNDKIEVE